MRSPASNDQIMERAQQLYREVGYLIIGSNLELPIGMVLDDEVADPMTEEAAEALRMAKWEVTASASREEFCKQSDRLTVVDGTIPYGFFYRIVALD